MTVTYIYHSGFCVELEEHVLIFDYYRGQLPEFDSKKTIVVFSSHGHPDHFSEKIFSLRKTCGRLFYVLSTDIQIRQWEKDVFSVDPRKKYNVEDLTIETLKSTDEGVAFLVHVEGKDVYYGGDLHWWHWEEEDDLTWNIPMEKAYCREIDSLEGRHFHVSFVPVDARLGEHYLYGIDYFMKKTDSDVVFPMHLQDYTIGEKLMSDMKERDYGHHVRLLSEPLQSYTT